MHLKVFYHFFFFFKKNHHVPKYQKQKLQAFIFLRYVSINKKDNQILVQTQSEKCPTNHAKVI